MELKKIRIEGWEVDYQDWDDFVNYFFGFQPRISKHGSKDWPYEFVEDTEANNYASYEYTSDGKISDYALKEVEEWRKNPKSNSYITSDVFDYISYKGGLPKGTYYIHVSW
jgi:hypothetical protein